MMPDRRWRLRHALLACAALAGSNDGDRFDLRGHGKTGVARSKDLLEWRAPPD